VATSGAAHSPNTPAEAMVPCPVDFANLKMTLLSKF
jgi:hypothetical protein